MTTTEEIYQKARDYGNHHWRCVPCGFDKKALTPNWRDCATWQPEKMEEFFKDTDNLLAFGRMPE
jgi:hypothetical protein